MAIDNWTEEQLARFVRQEIDRATPPRELPEKKLREAGDVVIFDGEKWQTVSLKESPFLGLIAKRISYGTDAVNWGFFGGTLSNVTTITHRLQGLPKIVLVTVENYDGAGAGSEPVIAASVQTITTTTFSVVAEYVTGAGAPGTQARNFFWLAIR